MFIWLVCSVRDIGIFKDNYSNVVIFIILSTIPSMKMTFLSPTHSQSNALHPTALHAHYPSFF